jgi:hypothetical protein
MTVSIPLAPLEPDQERALAAQLFNHTWALMEKPVRSREDDDAMIDSAHASGHHWRQVGTPVNLARSQWQISRVYTLLGRSEPARHHAQRSLEICLAHHIRDFDLAFAHEAIARAAAMTGDAATRDKSLAAARAAALHIADQEDRDYVLRELGTIPH